LGRAGSGSAVVFGPTTDGLSSLRYLEKTDALRQAQQTRAQAAANKQKETEQNAILAKTKFNTDGGLHYLPQMNAKRQQLYQDIQAVATDATKSRTTRQLEVQQKMDDWNAELAAGKTNDDYLDSELKRYQQDRRYNTTVASQRLTNSLYEHQPDGSLALDEQGQRKLVPALVWDRQAATQAMSTGNEHLNGTQVFKQFAELEHPDSVTVSKQPLPGGRGYSNTYSSNYFEVDPATGNKKIDPRTSLPVVRVTPETLRFFDSDAVNRQYLDAEVAKHNQLVTSATEKMGQYTQLTPEETEAVELGKAPEGPRLGLFQRNLLNLAYERSTHNVLQKAAPRSPANGRIKSPKFQNVGGSDYAPELVGGTAAGGTSGLLALASSDPLGRIKADGTVQPHTARAVHSQYILLQNGQPSRLVTNNTEPQNLSYQKPQLFLTTGAGNIVTPKDGSLLQRYQAGDKQPLLDFVRAQREAHPDYKLRWFMHAVPTDGKLTGQVNATAIYQRLVDDRNKAGLTAGQAGYHGDDELHSAAQKLAREQGGSLLIPYTGDAKRDIDLAIGYHLRDAKRERRRQDEFDRFNSQTAPRPAEQRAAPKKLGIDFGTKSAPTAPPTPAPTAPSFKRAGTKKTGISF